MLTRRAPSGSLEIITPILKFRFPVNFKLSPELERIMKGRRRLPWTCTYYRWRRLVNAARTPAGGATRP